MSTTNRLSDVSQMNMQLCCACALDRCLAEKALYAAKSGGNRTSVVFGEMLLSAVGDDLKPDESNESQSDLKLLRAKT